MARKQSILHSDTFVALLFLTVLIGVAAYSIYAKYYLQPTNISSEAIVVERPALEESTLQRPALPTVPTRVDESDEVIESAEDDIAFVPFVPEAPLVAGIAIEAEPVVSPCATLNAFSSALLCYINEARAENNSGPLSFSSELSEVATDHASWMSEHASMTHYGQDGLSPTERCAAAGVTCWGENLAMGTTNPQEMFELWLANPDHRHIMLNSRYSQIGLGLVDGYTSALFN